MYRIASLLLLVNILIFSGGCSTMGKPYSPPPPPKGKDALVHFMRSSVGYGNFWITSFYVNDVDMVSLYDKGYSWIHLKEGTYRFKAKAALGKGLEFTMPVKAGNKYYLEYTQESVGYNRYRNVLRAVRPDFAESIIGQYSYKEANKTTDLQQEMLSKAQAEQE